MDSSNNRALRADVEDYARAIDSTALMTEKNMSETNQTDDAPRHLLGDTGSTIATDIGDIDYKDRTIAFFCDRVRGRSVLDIGCVNHNPENYRSRYWLHKALRAVASRCLGMDLYAPGVSYLCNAGYDIVLGNAEDFDLGRRFDRIVAGEIIEHLGNVSGFLESVKRHLTPDGLLLISTPNPWYWRFVVKAMLWPDVRPNREHVSWFCFATLGSLLSRHGFHIAEFDRSSRYLRDRLMPLPPGLRHSTLLFVAKLSETETLP
jgi:SAM-dependent methyltransferase